MKKLLISMALFGLLLFIFYPQPAAAWSLGDPIVPQNCGKSGSIRYNDEGECISGDTCPCGISHFFTLLANIYSFIVLALATPLAVMALIVGGILIIISAGRPDVLGLGKKIIFSAIIGLVLVFASWLIINFVLCEVLGYTRAGGCSWSTL